MISFMPLRRLDLLLRLCLLLLVVSILAPSASAKVRLKITGIPNGAQVDEASIVERRIIERFQALNPDIELVPAEGIRIPNLVTEASTLMMIVADNAPDVIRLNFRSVDTFVSRGFLEPLDAYARSGEHGEAGLKDRILPQVKDVVYRPGPDGVKHLYGLPYNFKVMGLYFNRALFRQAGLPERAPQDWQEMEEFAQKVTALGKPYKGLFLQGGQVASWHLCNLIWSMGGEVVKEIAPNEWRAVYNSPEAIKSLEYYYKLTVIDDVVLRMQTKLPGMFREVGMYFSYIGDDLDYDPDEFGFGAMPKGPTGMRGSEINSLVMGVYSQIKDPKVKEAAWRYILFMTSPEVEKIRADSLVELGRGGQLNPSVLRRFGHTQYLALAPKGLEEEFIEAVKHGKPEPYGKNCNLVYYDMTYPLDEILLSSSIRKAWDRGDMESVRQQMKEILDRGVERANERMSGYVPKETLRLRRIVAGTVAVLVVVSFALGIGRIVRMFSRSSSLNTVPISSHGVLPWLFLAPALLLILTWHYVPVVHGALMAFQDYQVVLKSAWVGLDNFGAVLFDRLFWKAVLVTLHYSAYCLTIGFAAPILLAYALHLIPKHKVFFRTLYYLPSIISGTAVFFLWFALFGADGAFNELLRFFGMDANRAWMDDPNLAMLTCIIPSLWAGMGPGCLIYLAALKTIPDEQFEAAEIEGAGFLQKTFHIVYPTLRPLVFINFVGAVAAAFHGSGNILIMTGGGPNGLTEVLGLKIFFEAFVRLRFGPSAAMAWVLGSMLVGLTVIQVKRLSRMEFKAPQP